MKYEVMGGFFIEGLIEIQSGYWMGILECGGFSVELIESR